MKLEIILNPITKKKKKFRVEIKSKNPAIKKKFIFCDNGDLETLWSDCKRAIGEEKEDFTLEELDKVLDNLLK